MNLSLDPHLSHPQALAALRTEVEAEGYRVLSQDDARPWGGFLVLDEIQAERFLRSYFPAEDASLLCQQRVSPKMLLVAPGKRLSWQYHHRRAELWRVALGTVDVARSLTDDQGIVETYVEGDTLQLAQGERHRLIGRDEWGVVAEVWRHTDPHHPSDEGDIIRLQDDFGR
jgi:mannose-6-phosphate isomerase-like protein (cupin superfamily)